MSVRCCMVIINLFITLWKMTQIRRVLMTMILYNINTLLLLFIYYVCVSYTHTRVYLIHNARVNL
jgi:hypothetical protein